jgi:thiamine-phosphate pyrophosphorylase
MKQFLSRIDHNYWERLVLHNHHHLASLFGIGRIHFSESKRKTLVMLPGKFPFEPYKTKGFQLSTSAHAIEDFNAFERRLFSKNRFV